MVQRLFIKNNRKIYWNYLHSYDFHLINYVNNTIFNDFHCMENERHFQSAFIDYIAKNIYEQLFPAFSDTIIL